MGASESYSVLAKLELGAQNAVKGLDGILKKLDGLKAGVGKLNLGFDGLVTKAVALGATYFGFSAMTRGMKAFGAAVFKTSGDVETMIMSLSTIYSAVEKVSFAKATQDANVLFKVFERIAIQSTATTQELMDVFKQIYGPLRGSGLKMQEIVDTTNNAVVAASALGVDFAQASRDISAMARGTAGLDVKMFSLLQSMGLIKETTEQWNKLAPDKRAKKLVEVMAKIGGEAGEAYGKTWKGISSTFSDIMGAFKRAFGGAVFERMKGTLEKINAYLLTNRARIESYLRVLGERVGTIFDKVVNNAGRTFHTVVNNIDRIRARLSEIYAGFQEIKPILVTAAKFALAMKVATMAFSVVAPLITVLVSGLSWLAGLIGSIATAGGLSAWIAGLGASISSVGAMIAAAAGPIALAIAVIVVLVLAIIKWKDTLWAMLKPLGDTFKSIGEKLYTIFKDLWVAVKPLLELVGGVLLMQLIAQLRMMAWVIDKIILPPLQLMAKIIRWAFEEILNPLISAFEPVLKVAIAAFEFLADGINSLVDVIKAAVGAITGVIGGIFGGIKGLVGKGISMLPGMTTLPSLEGLEGLEATVRKRAADDAAAKKALDKAAAAKKAAADAAARAKQAADEKRILESTRPQTVNDFRGSKIDIKQEFREADPDNVWVQFREGLEREATARTRSGFADPLAR